MGGLTFDRDDPSGLLKRPNFIAARRFGYAILSRIGLYDSMTNALHFLLKTGDLKKVLAGTGV
jgi:hypothetical protein